MFIKSVLVAVVASAVGLSVVGCMSAETADPAAENVDEAAQALTTGITFDPTTLYLNYAVSGTSAGLNVHYYPGSSTSVFEVPCNATQVGVQTNIKYNDTGAQLWPAVTFAVPGLTAATANLSPMLQGATATFGSWANSTSSPLTGAAADTTLAIVMTLKSYTNSSYTTLSGVPFTTMTFYVRRMCSCT